MKFSVIASEMIGSLDGMIKLSTKSGMKDFFGFNKIKIKSSSDGLNFSIFNGQAAITGQLNSELSPKMQFEHKQDGEVTVDASYLKRALDSFRKDDKVIIEKTDKEVIIKKATDEDQFNSINFFGQELQLPQPSKSFGKQVKLDKDLFVNSVNKIKFAFGFEQTRPKFKQWALRLNTNYARFAAGNGGLFAVNTYSGAGISDASKKIEFNISGDITEKQILPFLKEVKGKQITIKTSGKDCPYQIVITDGAHTMSIVGLDPDIEFIDQATLLNKKTYDNKFLTNVKDWGYAVDGAMATFTSEMKKQSKPHKSTLNFNSSQNVILLKIDQTLKSKRKIAILDSESVSGEHNCSTYSEYLTNIAGCYTSEGNIQIECQTGTGNKAVIVHYNAGDKIEPSDTLKSISSAGYDQKFALVFIQMIP